MSQEEWEGEEVGDVARERLSCAGFYGSMGEDRVAMIVSTVR